MLEDFGFPILAIIVILLMVYFMLNKNKVNSPRIKPMWKWAIGWGIYALIPLLLAGNFETQGDKSPLYMLLLPPFWPLALLVPLSSRLLYLLISLGLKFDSSLSNGIIMLLNAVWAFLIGMLIGFIIQKVRKNEK